MASSRQVACWVVLGLSALGPPISVAAQEPTADTALVAVVDQYRRARARTMQAGATDADVPPPRPCWPTRWCTSTPPPAPA